MDKARSLRLVIMGRPGAGKGTQARLLAERFGLANIDLGRLLRHAASGDDHQARVLTSLLSRGLYAPAELSLSLLRADLERRESKAHGFVIDGYPRFVDQVDILGELIAPLEITGAALLNVSTHESLGRLEKRRECATCMQQPTGESAYYGLCEFCGGRLIGRADDQRDALLQRISTFEAKMRSVIQRYEEEMLLHRIDGAGPVQLVHERLLAALGFQDDIFGDPLI